MNSCGSSRNALYLRVAVANDALEDLHALLIHKFYHRMVFLRVKLMCLQKGKYIKDAISSDGGTLRAPLTWTRARMLLMASMSTRGSPEPSLSL